MTSDADPSSIVQVTLKNRPFFAPGCIRQRSMKYFVCSIHKSTTLIFWRSWKVSQHNSMALLLFSLRLQLRQQFRLRLQELPPFLDQFDINYTIMYVRVITCDSWLRFTQIKVWYLTHFVSSFISFLNINIIPFVSVKTSPIRCADQLESKQYICRHFHRFVLSGAFFCCFFCWPKNYCRYTVWRQFDMFSTFIKHK